MLVVDLGKWMNKTLINWGIDPAVADRFDETIMALLMIVVAIVGSSSNLVVISFLFQLSSSFLILLKVVDMFAF